MELIAKITTVNIEEMTMEVKFAFTSPQEISKLEDFIIKDKPIKMKVTPLHGKKAKTMEQHRKWFKMVHQILEHFQKEDPGILINADAIKALHEDLKRSTFPLRSMKIGSTDIPIIPSITDLSLNDLREAIQKVIDRYSHLVIGLISPEKDGT